MKLKLALLAAAGSLVLASAASAQDTGYYGALGLGYTFDNDENDFESVNEDEIGAFVTDYDLDPALNIYGAFGKYFANGIRGELELATRSQDVDELPGDGLGFAGFASDGDLGEYSVTTLMVNVYKDFDVDMMFTPYVGAGLGAAFMRAEADNSAYTTFATSPAQPSLIAMGDRDTSVAGQLMAGITAQLTDVIDVDVRYKYLLTDSFEYGAYIDGPLEEVGGGYEANELTAGLRWNFGAPAPVVQPEPEPEPVTYKDCWDGSRVVSTAQCPPEPVETPTVVPDDLDLVVYFDFDKSNLSVAAQDLISAKSAEALEYDITGVTVQGNTDTSGSASYNNALSARRAAVVSDALVANGIPSGLITTQALGESNPAEPTGDGVREPLNRRTEVMFDF